jgi:hypothetical protein
MTDAQFEVVVKELKGIHATAMAVLISVGILTGIVITAKWVY